MNDDRKIFLQTQIMAMLELDGWKGPSGMNDLEKLYVDLVALQEEEE